MQENLCITEEIYSRSSTKDVKLGFKPRDTLIQKITN